MARKSTRVRYEKLVPNDTFIGQYLKYMDPQETAYSYDFWTACYLLSIAIGRGTVVNRPRAPVHLNLYLILVAESGVTRKSSSIREAVRFARPLCETTPLLIESKITPELLLTRLHEQGKKYDTGYAAIAISELVTFMGREKYVEAMPTLLTDLYDCPELRSPGGSISAGGQTLRNVFVSFLSASTPSWLLRAVNPDVIEGGFTSRVLFIVSEVPKRLNSWPEAGDEDAVGRITEQLKSIRERSAGIPSIEINETARRTFDRWYKTRIRGRDAFRSSFQSREDAHILRLAALLCINDSTWCIQNSHILAAIKIITQVREDGASIFEGTGNNSRLVIGIDKLRDKLLAAGQSGLPQTDLTKAVAMFMNAEHMKAALAIMHELQMVQKFENIQVARGRPVTIWRGTSELGKSKALDRIIEQHSPEAR